jgi:3-oxoadipate enol-lactonase
VTVGLAFEQQGQGADAVVLLHGIGGGKALWGAAGSNTVQTLATLGCRVLALDLPGYGESESLGPPTLARMVATVGDLIDSLNARRVAVVGHSMGGMIAQELWATRPQTPLHALVLACTSPAFGKAEGDWQARFVAERLAPLDAGLGMVGMAERLVPGMVSPQAVADGPARAVAVMSRVPEATYRAALQAIVAFDRRAALPTLSIPTLCLAAEHDRTAPPEVMRRMADKLPNGRYLCLSGAGHIANVEQPDSFHAAVLNFLKDNGFGP